MIRVPFEKEDIEIWIGLINMYKQLNEPDAVKGLIMKVFAKNPKVRKALDIFENKKFS